MKKSVFASLMIAGLIAAIPATARIATNRIATNGVTVQGFDHSNLSVQSLTTADGTVISLN